MSAVQDWAMYIAGPEGGSLAVDSPATCPVLVEINSLSIGTQQTSSGSQVLPAMNLVSSEVLLSLESGFRTVLFQC